MPLFDRFKNLFRGQGSVKQTRHLPAVIEHDVNPDDYWEVVGELGDGAFGKVEKVVNKADRNLLAAAKNIEIEDGEQFEDFLVEIEILTQCTHENIVGLIACYFFNNKISMMLEFCAGGAVDGIMLELEKPLTEPQIAYITRYVCVALEFLHNNLVIHRDLKAGNILLTSDANIKLADFGVSAKMKDNNERRDSFIGTPYWMAPEVMVCETFKDQPYGCLADIWSLGITLIEMAQMDPPNYQVSPMRVVIKVQKSDPPTLDRPAQWSIYFNDFIAKCLVKNPNDRYSATDLLTHSFIKDALDKKPVMQLLFEKNADILKEEVFGDEHSSTAGSVADSELSPAGQEAIDILDDLYNVLDDDEQVKTQADERVTSSPSSAMLETANSFANSTYYTADNGEAPPPEPPIDYDDPPDLSKPKTTNTADDNLLPARKASQSSITIAIAPLTGSQPSKSISPKLKSRNLSESCSRMTSADDATCNNTLMLRKSPQRVTVTKKTRAYIIDGVEVTSTTHHVFGVKQDHELKKKEMRDLKRMQREETRQQQEFTARLEQMREQQERKFTFERQAIQKAYEAETEALGRMQKKRIEELERLQEDEMRNLVKKIRVEQERDLRVFKERLKQEHKLLKKENDTLPKTQRKEMFHIRKNLLNKSHYEREADFLVQLDRNHDIYMRRAREKHREKMAETEREFLKQKHILERNMEAALFELEDRHYTEKHALITQQFKDYFHLQRTQMLARHHKELEHIRKINQASEEELLRALTADRKAIPKALRNESKTRTIMFKESLRIEQPNEGVEKWAQKIQNFEAKEKQRIRLKMEEYDLKSKRRLAKLVARNQGMVKELEEIHNEKRNMLVDNERAKLLEYQKEYEQIKQAWQAGLSARKMALEIKFEEELKTQERFYNIEPNIDSMIAASSSADSGTCNGMAP